MHSSTDFNQRGNSICKGVFDEGKILVAPSGNRGVPCVSVASGYGPLYSNGVGEVKLIGH